MNDFQYEQDDWRGSPVDFSVIEEIPLVVSLVMNRDKDKFPEIFESLDEKHFFNVTAKKIYKACYELYIEGKDVELSTVHSKADMRASELMELVNKNIDFVPINSIESVKRIVESYHRRQIYDFTEKTQKSFLENIDFEDLVISIQEQGDDLAKVFEPKTEINIDKIVDKLEKEVENNKDHGLIGYKTKFPELDRATEGFVVPHLWIIGGYTGTGKTFFTLSMMLGMLRNGASIVLFSTENSATRNVLRLIGCMTGISEMTMLKGKIENELMGRRIENAKAELKKFKLFIYDNVFDTKQIRAIAKKHKIRDGVQIVIIDYIQALNTKNTAGDIYKQMSTAAMDLQRISIDLGMGVIGVSQVSNAEAMKNSDELMTFKGAGEITAVSDVAIWLRRDKKDITKLNAHIKKIRHGLPKSIKFNFFSKTDMKENYRYISEAEDQKGGWD